LVLVFAALGIGLVLFFQRDAGAASPEGGDSAPPDESGGIVGGGDQGGPVAVDELEVAALGRVIVSELGSGTADEKAAIAWTVRQRAQAKQVTIYALEAPGGAYGEQGSARPFSSAQAATSGALDFARGILSQPLSASPWPAAGQFFEPGAQDQLYAMGTRYRAGGGACGDSGPRGSSPGDYRGRCYFHDAQSIRDKWTAQGDVQIAIVGRIELWTAVRA
jgi:hypothetical protein